MPKMAPENKNALKKKSSGFHWKKANRVRNRETLPKTFQ